MSEHTVQERSGNDLIGMSVISIKEGRTIGEVTALLIHREDCKVTALRVGSQHTPDQAVPFSHFRQIGADVILVDSEASLKPALSTEAIKRLDDAIPGRAVITDSGEHIGTISSFKINTITGKIPSYRIDPDASLISRLTNFFHDEKFEVKAAKVRSLGPDALIVMDNVADKVESAQPATEPPATHDEKKPVRKWYADEAKDHGDNPNEED